MTIVAGHGPKNSGILDPGAIGKGGLKESGQNFQIMSKVNTKLQALQGVQTQFLHDGDLWDVSEGSDKWKADLYVSGHCNASVYPTANGIETFIIGRGGPAEKLANAIQRELVKATGLRDRGVSVANLHELRETNAPAVLIEMGFISNPSEEKLMNNDAWDEKVAQAIYVGIVEYAGLKTVPVPVMKDDPDVYLSVRVRASKADKLAQEIIKMGYACKKLDLA